METGCDICTYRLSPGTKHGARFGYLHFGSSTPTRRVFLFQALFFDLEAAARTVLPENRRCVKSYINTSGLSELWLVVNSLTSDGLSHRGLHQAPETEPLNALRAEIMVKETAHIQSRLQRVQYQLESPETVR